MGQLRIEFALLGTFRGQLGGQIASDGAEPLGAVTLAVTSTATAAGAQPTVPQGAGDAVHATLVALDVPIYVDVGTAPDPTAEPRRLVVPGRPLRVHVAPGDRFGAILASDVVLPASGASGLSAGESHLGEVGGNVAKVQVQFGPASSTTYANGQAMAAAIELPGMGRVANGTGLVTGATLELAAASAVQIDLVVFASQPTGGVTAASAFQLAAGDRAKVSKVIKLTDWTALGTADSLGEAIAAPRFYRCDDIAKPTSLWVVPVARGSVTLAAATDATLTLRVSRN